MIFKLIGALVRMVGKASIRRRMDAYVLAVERNKDHLIQAQRTCLGLLSEQKRYGSDRLEKACALAISRQLPYIPVIKKLLKNGEDMRWQPDETKTIIPGTHTNIRGSKYYQ